MAASAATAGAGFRGVVSSVSFSSSPRPIMTLTLLMLFTSLSGISSNLSDSSSSSSSNEVVLVLARNFGEPSLLPLALLCAETGLPFAAFTSVANSKLPLTSLIGCSCRGGSTSTSSSSFDRLIRKGCASSSVALGRTYVPSSFLYPMHNSMNSRACVLFSRVKESGGAPLMTFL